MVGHVTNFPYGISTPFIIGATFPTQGNVFFVKPRTGSDGNSGKSPANAFKTLVQALSVCTANQNDVVFLMAEGDIAASTTDYQSVTLDWNKNATHLIGISAPSAFSNRARIAQLSTATGLTSLVTVSANECMIENIGIFHGVADATSLVALKITGSRNVFKNCTIAGIGNATQVTAGAASLSLIGASENKFENCTIGLDTISRDQTCTEISFTTSSSRNLFENCIINSYVSNAGFASVTVGTNGIDRTLIFKDCLFMAKSTNKSITQTSVFSIPAISQGAIVLKDSAVLSDGGATDWDSNNRGIIWNNSGAAAASAAGGIMTNQ